MAVPITQLATGMDYIPGTYCDRCECDRGRLRVMDYFVDRFTCDFSSLSTYGEAFVQPVAFFKRQRSISKSKSAAQ